MKERFRRGRDGKQEEMFQFLDDLRKQQGNKEISPREAPAKLAAEFHIEMRIAVLHFRQYIQCLKIPIRK